jgi:hypothetical protein
VREASSARILGKNHILFPATSHTVPKMTARTAANTDRLESLHGTQDKSTTACNSFFMNKRAIRIQQKSN